MRQEIIEVDSDYDNNTDGFACSDCGQHIGWDIDTDDDGRAVGVFTQYWGTRVGLVCEDCLP